MSSKATIFLTNDNEHFYEECNDPHYVDDKYIGFTLVLEMSKKNIEILVDDNEDLIVEIKPGCELHKFLMDSKQP